MNACNDYHLTRRAFLKNAGLGLGLFALADPLMSLAARSYAQSSGGTGNLLVLCQLSGGVDALSMLAPYQNSVYQSRRPNLALRADEVNPLPGAAQYGLNKHLQFFSDLYAQNQLAIVQQVAYPDGNGSHFESQEIYELGVRDLHSSATTSHSWYERLRRTYFDEPYGVLDTRAIGDPRRFGYPDRTHYRAAQEAFGRLARLKAERRAGIQKEILQDYDQIDRDGAAIRERTANFNSSGPATGEFFRAAALASAGLGTQIIKLRYGGFDTHGSQRSAHDRLFPQLNDEFKQFVDDAKALGIWDRTCVLFYTEFGRRNEENGSPGTDHGHGGHMILAGPGVAGGLKGQNVSSADLNQKNLPYYVDFRAVFGATVRDWLGFDPKPIFEIGNESYDTNPGGTLFA